jgi:hypothetical protein
MFWDCEVFVLPWIVDIDSAVKPRYGHQDAALLGCCCECRACVCYIDQRLLGSRRYFQSRSTSRNQGPITYRLPESPSGR